MYTNFKIPIVPYWEYQDYPHLGLKLRENSFL